MRSASGARRAAQDVPAPRIGMLPPEPPRGPVVSWWGAVVPNPLRLAVVDPSLPGSQSQLRLQFLHAWVSPRRRYDAVLAVACGVFVVVALFMAWTALHGSQLLPAIVLGGLGVLLIPMSIFTARLAFTPRPTPPDVIVRNGVSDALWRLVHHLDTYRRPDDDATDAVRQLLWALARSGPATDHLVADFTAEFTATTAPPSPRLRSFAAQLWATTYN